MLIDSIYEIWNIIKNLRLDYVKIDQYLYNDCILYRGKEYEKLGECSIWEKSSNKKIRMMPLIRLHYSLLSYFKQRLIMSKHNRLVK